MLRCFMKSKIHRAKVTGSNLEYEGSITIDRDLMDAADLKPFERVDVYNITNGNRFQTYVIEGQRGKGEICLNGAAARLCHPGDLVIIVSYAYYEENSYKGPKIIHVDDNNKIK